MFDSQPLAPPRRRSRLLITSSALLATAGVLGLTGLGLATVALAAVARRRIDRMEVPPRELARRRWQQAKAAVGAGAGAWRRNGATLHVVEVVAAPAADSREPATSS